MEDKLNLYMKDMFEVSLKGSFMKLYGIAEVDGITLNNKSKVLSDTEIQQIIELLHSDYKELDMNITIYGSRLSSFLRTLNPFSDSSSRKTYASAFKGCVTGSYRKGEIDVFSHNRRVSSVPLKYRKSCAKLLTIATLLHEIRHAYQEHYKKENFESADRNYIDASGKGYHSQWIERDANKFVQRMMNKNMERINEMLGIDFSWDCRWGSFKVDF